MNRFLLVLCAFISFQLAAQSYEVTGQLTSSKDGVPLVGAHVSLLHPWGEAYKATASDASGFFKLENVPNGGYLLKATYLGFQELQQEITIVDQSIDLGQLIIEEGGVVLEEVEVKEQLPVATQEGDTTSYNAEAFKTMPDANAEDLVGKLPGVTLDKGRVSAQGENIQEVLVDGRRFFGNDPTAALRTLPAEVISKIQIFDQQSEQAQFSGVEDGQTTKTINIITKPNMRNGQFGKIYAGYGTDERYQAGGNTSFFDGSRRISIIGQTNNVNQQNFSTEDLLGVTGSSGRRGGGRGFHGGRGGSARDFLVDQQGGISKTHAIGINFSDQWGEKLDITGSYFFNLSDNVANEISSTEYITGRSEGEIYNEIYDSKTENVNHRANFRITYSLSERSSFILRPRITVQQNDGQSFTDGMTSLQENLLNETNTSYNSDLSAVDFQNYLLFRHRFLKKGRTFSVSLRTTYGDDKGESQLSSRNTFYRDMIDSDTLDQFSDLLTKGWTNSANVNYTEPLGEATSLNFSYRTTWQNEQSDRETMDRNIETGEYDLLNTPLTNVFENDYLTHSGGIGFNYRKGRDLFGMIRASVQSSSLVSDETFPNPVQIERSFFNFVPFAMLRYNFTKQKNLRVFYRTNTQSPSVTQLQNVIDNTNPLQLRAGNPELDQSYSHRLFIRYKSSDIERASVFFILLSGSITQDYVGNATYLPSSDHPILDTYEVEQGAQLTIPVNLDGYRNFRVFTTYGLPVKFLKTNLNLELSGNYIRIPGLIDDVQNISNNRSLTTGITFASNISEKVDFTIGTRVGYNNVKNSIQDQLNNVYWTQNSRAKIGVIFPAGFVLRSDVTHQLYRGLSDTFNEDYFLWNIAVGKKVLKNDLGEISLSVFDLLKQNQNIQRNVTETYIEDQRINVLQQFFMLNFTYNFRNFRSKKAVPERNEDERRRNMPFHH